MKRLVGAYAAAIVVGLASTGRVEEASRDTHTPSPEARERPPTVSGPPEPSVSKYNPHQGERERARRAKRAQRSRL